MFSKALKAAGRRRIGASDGGSGVDPRQLRGWVKGLHRRSGEPKREGLPGGVALWDGVRLQSIDTRSRMH